MENKLIVCNRHVGFGMPILNGRRLTVYNIVSKIYLEETLEFALSDYEISLAEAKAAIDYCEKLHCQQQPDRLHYCDGCILRTIEEGWDFNKDDYKQINPNFTTSHDGQFIFLGSLNQLEEESYGKPGWAIASSIKEKYPQLI
jgi:uncharacterized protein (DUF433 family)